MEAAGSSTIFKGRKRGLSGHVYEWKVSCNQIKKKGNKDYEKS